MVSPVIVHTVGITVLILILAVVMGYVWFKTLDLIVSNEKHNLQEIADSIAFQIQYMLKINTNISLTLRYPVYSIYDRMFNVEIGSGRALKGKYGFLTNLRNDAIYVLTISVDYRAYGWSFIVDNSTKPYIYLSKNPFVFSSGTIVVIDKSIIKDRVELNINIVGVRVG